MLDTWLQVGSVMDTFNKRLWQISNLIKRERESEEVLGCRCCWPAKLAVENSLRVVLGIYFGSLHATALDYSLTIVWRFMQRIRNIMWYRPGPELMALN